MKHSQIKKLIELLKTSEYDDLCSCFDCNWNCLSCSFYDTESLNELIKELEELI